MHLNLNRYLAAGLFLAAAPLLLPAQPVKKGALEVELVSEAAAISPGKKFTVGLRLKHDPHWHTYWVSPGDVGVATSVKWELPEGFRAGPVQWPQPERVKMGSITAYGYEGEVLLLTEITPPDTLQAGGKVRLGAKVSWLCCAQVCVIGHADVALALPARAIGETDERWHRVFEKDAATFARPLPGFRLEAARAGAKVMLTVSPPAGANPVAPDDIYFFSSDGQVASDLPQSLKRRGANFVLELPRSEFAPDDSTHLRGILYHKKGWLPGGKGHALAVDVAYR